MLRFIRNQTPLTVIVEILFALLLVMIFLATQGRGFSLPTSTQPENERSIAPSLPQDTQIPIPQSLSSQSDDGSPAEGDPIDDDEALRGLDCRELIVNGDFERFGGWQMPVTSRPGSLTNERVYAGQRSLKLGTTQADQHLSGDSVAAQTVDLPVDADAIFLRAQLWQEGDGDGADSQYLLIESDQGARVVFDEVADRREWRAFRYDLTDLGGRAVRILFGASNDGEGGRTVLYVDDVSVLACWSSAEDDEEDADSHRDSGGVDVAAEVVRPSAIRSPEYGVNAFLWQSEVAQRDLNLIDDAAFSWVRQRFAWEEIETVAAQFQWEAADIVVDRVNRQGLKLLAHIDAGVDGNDFWAGAPPQNTDAYVEFVSAVAQRYNCSSAARGCIDAYEIWSEPNLARHWGGNQPSPAEYLAMLSGAYAAIKAANPNALVISAGMAPTGTNSPEALPDQLFYEEMYRLLRGNVEGYFDLLGVNAVGFAAPPELPPAQAAANPQYGGHRFFTFRHVEDIRAIMEAYGDDATRIAVLEFGWTSDAYHEESVWYGASAGIDEFVKADYLRRAIVYAEATWQPWIALMTVFTMPDVRWLADGNPFDEEAYWWAILEPSHLDEVRFRPAYITLCDVLNQRRGTDCPRDE